MIVERGYWTCFRCGNKHPNRIVVCTNCNDTKKHSENMRRDLGMDACIDTKKCRNGEELAKRREEKEKYQNNKSKFENIINKYFRYLHKIKLFKDKEKEDSLYYGFDKDGFHYTIRRDKI